MRYYLIHNIAFCMSSKTVDTVSPFIFFLFSSFASKDVCCAGMDIEQSFHAPANGALHAGGSFGTSTRRTDKMNGKDKDVHSLQDDLYLKQGHLTDLPEAFELRRRTMMDNGKVLSSFCSRHFLS